MDRYFERIELGPYTLRNRIVMAPLTRRRAGVSRVPNALMAEYYGQRASAGLIIAEASQVSPQGTGYLNTPGIHSKEQVEGWKAITKAIHDKGGCIFLQLWHVGRISHPLLQPGNELPVSASAVGLEGQVNTPEGRKDFVVPRALETEEIPGIVEDFRKAATNAIEAGFDGVQVHGANSYLPDQFLNNFTNNRKDWYGGSFENRSRFLFEILESVCKEIGSERVGLRLSPSGIKFGVCDTDPVGIYSYVIKNLQQFNLSHLELVEPLEPVDHFKQYLKTVTPFYRKLYKGLLISNGGYTPKSGLAALEEGLADMISFGKPYIANPDLPERIRVGVGLNEPDKSTFYSDGAYGYTDYPFMDVS